VHVAAGVAVGQRVDVERVDLRRLALQALGRGADDVEQRAAVPA